MPSLSPSLSLYRDVKIQVDLPKRLGVSLTKPVSARMKSYMLDLSRKSGDGKWVCSRGLDRSGILEAWDGTQRQANRKDGVLTFSLVVTNQAVQSGSSYKAGSL